MKKHQITIMDIARELGISKSTVSRALTNNSNISPETKQAVMEAAKRLEYQPNLLAQSLIRNETHTIGVVIPDIEKPFFASIVSGIQQQASRAGYRVIITQSNESPETEIMNVQALVLSRVDGLLICHTRETRKFDHVQLLYRKGIPLVFFARICPDIPVPKVVEDDFRGAYTMTQHLIERGYRNIALIAGPEDLLISRLRKEGYLAALRDHNLPLREELVAHTQFRKEEVPETMQHWLSLRQRPDAIFSMYDAGAIEVIRWLKKEKIKIPTQMAVAGFGNDPAASIIEPGLTTYSQSPAEIGRIACGYFLEQLVSASEPTVTEAKIVEGTLLVREST